jgi:hypothetical protein
LFALDCPIAQMLAIFGASWKLVFTPLTKKIRQLQMLKGQILEFDRMLNAWQRSNDPNKRLDDRPRRRLGAAPLWLANQITPM